MGGRVRCRLLALMAVLGMMTSSTALASVSLPLHHWAYEAIERLVALGIIDRGIVATKPYSRKQAAIYVARAIERISSGDRRSSCGRIFFDASIAGKRRAFASTKRTIRVTWSR